MAFIVDIRRGNMDLHLMYKALFELSADRADFVVAAAVAAPPGRADAASTAAQIFSAFAAVEPSERYARTTTLASIRNQLVTEHRFPLSGDDLMRIEAIYRVFFLAGTKIQVFAVRELRRADSADLRRADDRDGSGRPGRSYLATEQAFRFMKDLRAPEHARAGRGRLRRPESPSRHRALRGRAGATVSAFYVSNVEEDLRQDGTGRGSAPTSRRCRSPTAARSSAPCGSDGARLPGRGIRDAPRPDRQRESGSARGAVATARRLLKNAVGTKP